MEHFHYIKDVSTIALDRLKCIGCGMCRTVCPHGVFVLADKKAEFAMKDACIECGACANNCPVDAISVNPGTGCAALIMERWFKGRIRPGNSCC